jgi:hypothetical protein
LETIAMSHGAASATMGGASEEQVRLRLQGLQHEVEKSATLVRRLGFLAILLILLLLILLIALYLYQVLQYAEVSSVEAVAVSDRPGVAEILYKPKSAGKIEFVRESDGLVQTLTEYANDPNSADKSDGKFTWSGKDNEKSQLQVTYRKGLFFHTENLPVKELGRKN